MNILSISLILLVVALNSSSACGLEQFGGIQLTTPKPIAYGGALNLLAPYFTKNTPNRRLHYRYYARHSVPSASKESQGLTSMDYVSDVPSLLKKYGLLAPHFTNKPHYSPPRHRAPSTFEGASGFPSAPYFVNTFANSRDQSPFAYERTRGFPAPYYANEPSYSPIPPPPMDKVSSLPGRPLRSHYFDDLVRDTLLNLLLRNKLPSASGRPHGYQIIYIPGGQSTFTHGGLSHPAPRPQPKATTHRRMNPDVLKQLLHRIMMSHGLTNSKPAFKPSTTNGNKAIGQRRRRLLFRPVNTHEHKARLSQVRPGLRFSQHRPTHDYKGHLFPKTIFTPLTWDS